MFSLDDSFRHDRNRRNQNRRSGHTRPIVYDRGVLSNRGQSPNALVVQSEVTSAHLVLGRHLRRCANIKPAQASCFPGDVVKCRSR